MWTTAKLQDVCNIFSGNSINAKEKEARYTHNSQGTPYVATKDVGFDGVIDYSNGVSIPLDFLDSFKTAPVGATLVCAEGGSAGRKIAITDREICFVNKLFSLCPNQDLHQKYLLYYTMGESFQKQFKDGLSGLIGGVSLSKIKAFDISFPSLYEQQRIVAILDQAFADIEKARANAEKNLKNARELFDSYLNQVFSQRGEGWDSKPLLELCDPMRGITYGVIKLGEEKSDGVPCLRTSNIRWLRIETKTMKRISPELSDDYSRTILNGGEVLVNVRGTLGGVAVSSKEMRGWNVSREVAVVPVNQNLVNPFFISYFIGASSSQAWLAGVKKGAAYVGINLEDLRLLPIKIPALKEQTEIVNQIRAIHKKTRQLEEVHRQKNQVLEELKKSLLQKAFSGELTKTEDMVA
jgi:type I restriction enzyme S subunit